MKSLTVSDIVAQLPASKQQFLAYIKNNNPKLYSHLMDIAAANLHVTLQGMGATPTTTTAPSNSFWDSITGAIKGIGTAASTIVPTILNAKTNQQILQTQLKLAEQGKPPLNTSQIQTPPTATVSFGTSKGVTYAMYGGLALIGIFIFSRLTK